MYVHLRVHVYNRHCGNSESTCNAVVILHGFTFTSYTLQLYTVIILYHVLILLYTHLKWNIHVGNIIVSFISTVPVQLDQPLWPLESCEQYINADILAFCTQLDVLIISQPMVSRLFIHVLIKL